MMNNSDCRQNAQRLASRVAIEGKHEPILVPTSKPNQHFHQRWWTTLPAIPATRDCLAYKRLWRQFADHTMNTFAAENGVFSPRNRGFYVEGREDHLVPAFFENFTLFPDFRWLENVLSRLGINHQGSIRNARWSYSYSELLPHNGGRPHVDLIVMWQDDRGNGVLAIETKKPGCGRAGFGSKDVPSNGHYLRYQKMRSVDRRHQALLIDENDLRYLSNGAERMRGVITWQDLIAIQRDAVEQLSQTVRNLVLSRLNAHFAELGFVSTHALAHPASANVTRYAELRALVAPASAIDWLIGSELFFAARYQDCVAELPYDWLAAEFTVFDYASRKLQTTRERELPIWIV